MCKTELMPVLCWPLCSIVVSPLEIDSNRRQKFCSSPTQRHALRSLVARLEILAEENRYIVGTFLVMSKGNSTNLANKTLSILGGFCGTNLLHILHSYNLGNILCVSVVQTNFYLW